MRPLSEVAASVSAVPQGHGVPVTAVAAVPQAIVDEIPLELPAVCDSQRCMA